MVKTDGEVEAQMRLDNLDFEFEPHSFPYAVPSVITFHHSFASPVKYCLTIGGKSVTKANQSWENGSRASVIFYFNEAFQKSLGPGKFSFILTLSNLISRTQFAGNISFDQPIKDFNVTTQNYVGIAPNYFVINLTLTEGAPVRIQLTIRKHPSAEIVSKISKYCYVICRRMNIRARVERGFYTIDASAYNNHHGVHLLWGPFEALPQVYDAYVTSLGSVMVDQVSTLCVFIRSDLGSFDLILHHEGKTHVTEAYYFATRYRHNDVVNVPFDPSRFVIVKVDIYFSRPGLNNIEFYLKNEKQKFSFDSAHVFVRTSLSCLQVVKIVGRKMKGKVLKIFSKTSLQAQVTDNCYEQNQMIFDWNIFLMETLEQAPRKMAERYKKFSNQKREFVIDPTVMSLGYYAVQVTVMMQKPGKRKIVDYRTDFLLINVVKPNLEIKIKGGETKEIGEGRS